MEYKGTKGEWIVVTSYDDDCYEVIIKNKIGEFGRRIVASSIEQGDDEGKSDALMIASAGNLAQKYGSLESLEKRMLKAEKESNKCALILDKVMNEYRQLNPIHFMTSDCCRDGMDLITTETNN